MKTVQARDGLWWQVRRVWVPRAPKWIGPRLGKRARPRNTRDRASPWWDFLNFSPGDLGDLEDGCGWFLLGALVLLLIVFVGVPLLIFVADLLLIGILVLLLALLRVAFRRPWLIKAETPGPPAMEMSWQVTGWAAGARAIELIATRIHSTGMPPQELPRV